MKKSSEAIRVVRKSINGSFLLESNEYQELSEALCEIENDLYVLDLLKNLSNLKGFIKEEIEYREKWSYAREYLRIRDEELDSLEVILGWLENERCK